MGFLKALQKIYNNKENAGIFIIDLLILRLLLDCVRIKIHFILNSDK